MFSEKGEANISYPYMLMGVVVLIVALVFSRIKLPEIVHTDNVVNGKTVKKGDIVCIIEAMKVMNEIKAPCDGTVTSILVENERL